MSKLKNEIVKAVRVGESDAGRVVGKSLKVMREFAGLTQSEMAIRLGIGQASISKIEQRGDIQISSLKSYVEALGAELRIDASFPADSPLIKQIQKHAGIESSLERQLVFPILDELPDKVTRDVVLSIHPKYSEKIMAGLKTVELRRRFPAASPSGTIAYIYSTSPVRAMVGSVEILGIKKMAVEQIWNTYSDVAHIDRDDFDLYFDGVTDGFALQFTNARPFSRKLGLDELRQRFSFEPPQSFKYAKPNLKEAIHNEFANLSN